VDSPEGHRVLRSTCFPPCTSAEDASHRAPAPPASTGTTSAPRRGRTVGGRRSRPAAPPTAVGGAAARRGGAWPGSCCVGRRDAGWTRRPRPVGGRGRRDYGRWRTDRGRSSGAQPRACRGAALRDMGRPWCSSTTAHTPYSAWVPAAARDRAASEGDRSIALPRTHAHAFGLRP
jgi:hypothetical protein